MAADTFEVAAYQHPLRGRPVASKAAEGLTVAEIVRQSDIDKRFLMSVQVVISRGINSSVVPMDQWHRVRPKAGSHVLIGPKVQGEVLGLVLAAVLPKAAAAFAGSFFAAGTVGYAVTYAAVTVVGSLAINALIRPPNQTNTGPLAETPNYTITGSANAENPYGVYPTVLGRHLMFPPKTAQGFTEGEGKNIHYRGRYTFGYGPVALESLKIGTTPIWEFDNVEIEFINVDATETLKNMPEIAPLVKAWRSGAEKLTLYPHDVAEDAYSVRLNTSQPVSRFTRKDTAYVTVDVTFQGLVRFDDGGYRHPHFGRVRYRYRKKGTAQWTDVGTEKHWGKSTSSIRFTHSFPLPSPDEYEIEVTRIDEDLNDNKIQDDLYLTGIQSVQAGGLPSHNNIAEVAIRVKASEQLNGQIDNLNGIVQQLGRTWSGGAWSVLKPVRHPAWVYARALMGPMLRDPVASDRIHKADLTDWADQEPHWTCDAVIDQPTTVADVLDLICASGRARRTMRDLKYSIVRDGGAGGIIQQFGPNNSRGFNGKISFPKQIHGFLVRCASEALDWQQDEIPVYADGYNASNATNMETLELPGVVLPKNATNGGNAWRLGRYHLAQGVLRPEEFTWETDIDHLKVTMGDKVRFVHDVPLIGVGSGRIKTLTLHPDNSVATFVLDEFLSLAGSSYRVIIRTKLGEELIFDGAPPVAVDGIWTVAQGASGDASGVAADDLVLIEDMAQESMEILVTSIRHNSDLTATLTGVPAAPAVLGADKGTIPAYVPNITNVQPRQILLPASPVASAIDPVVLYGPARVVFRITIAQHDRFDTAQYHVALKDAAGNVTNHGLFQTEEFDVPVPNLGPYTIELLRENTAGLISPPAVYQDSWDSVLTQPLDVQEFRADAVAGSVTLTWDANDPLVKHYEIRHLAPGNTGGWSGASKLVTSVQGGSVTVPVLTGSYLIRGIGHFDQQSPNAMAVTVSDGNVLGLNVVKSLIEHPAFSSATVVDLVPYGGRLYLGAVDPLSAWPALSQVGQIIKQGGVVPIGEYEFEEVVDLTGIFTSRISADVQANGYIGGAKLSTWPNLSQLGSLTGDVSDASWSAKLMMQSTNDDPAGSPVWSAWQEFRAGNHDARAYKFKLVVESFDPQVQVVVSRLSVLIDMPDRVEGGSDLAIPDTGIQITFQPAFKERPAINVTGQDLPSGAIEKITNVSRTGFHLQFVDAAAAGIAGTFDWIAKGYGREN